MPTNATQRAMRDVFAHMREVRPREYHGLFRVRMAMRVFSLYIFFQQRNITDSKLRGELLSSYYTYHRLVDDVGDKDVVLPPSARSRVDYVEQRLAFAVNPTTATDIADYLLLRSYELAGKLGFGLIEETASILESILRDTRRIEHADKTGRPIILTRADLDYHFTQLYLHGIMRSMLKLFDEDPEKAYWLKPIADADSIKLKLRDLSDNLRVGLVDIPQESMQEHNVMLADLKSVGRQQLSLDAMLSEPMMLPRGVREWIRYEAMRGLGLLEESNKALASHPFRTLGKLALRMRYLPQTRGYFSRIMQHTQPI